MSNHEQHMSNHVAEVYSTGSSNDICKWQMAKFVWKMFHEVIIKWTHNSELKIKRLEISLYCSLRQLKDSWFIPQNLRNFHSKLFGSTMQEDAFYKAESYEQQAGHSTHTLAKFVMGFQMSCRFYTFFYQTPVKKHVQCTAGCSRSALSAQQVHYIQPAE